VGYGDATFINFADGKCALIDGGDGTYSNQLEITSLINAHGKSKLNYLICTSVNEKRCGGLAELVQIYDVEKIFYPYCYNFRASQKFHDFKKIAKESGAEILVNYLPVGSEKAGKFYADCALEAGIAFINCVPIFIVSDPEYEAKFREKGIPCIGDDIKAQIGATITHRTLASLFRDRGVKLERTYQLNTGGNTDFLNMLNHDRLASKRESKTEAVQSVLAHRLDEDDIHIGPSDYVPFQKDNKLCFLRMEGKTFGDVPMNIELRLSVEDSPNSAGCVIDAIRCCKLALERGTSGALTSISSYIMKHPPVQYDDDEAHDNVEKFINGELDH
jgi:myo-inositol-1-phosphate synthase